MVICKRMAKIFPGKVKTYRKKYLEASVALYGKKQDIPVKPPILIKVKRKRSPSLEYMLQVKLVTWAKYIGLNLISIPNAGKRSYWQGQREVAMGLTKGVSDLYLAHMANGFGGFWIELKSPGEYPRPEQLAWMTKMREAGYRADWYNDFDKAKQAIEQYLSL